MVEAQLDDPVSRRGARTPTPGGYFNQHSRRKAPHSASSTIPLRNSLEIYDNVEIHTPTIFSGVHPSSGPDIQTSPDSMDDDDWKGTPPDHGKARSSRRHSRSQLAKSQRSSSSQHQPSLAHGYGTPAASSTEIVQNRNPDAFQGPSQQYPTTAASPYTQRPGYAVQYTMSPQPAPMLPHTPPSFGFPHTYHHPVAPDNIIQQNIHANYPPMLQPPVPVFPYQSHSPDASSPSRPSFSGSLSYPSHQVTPASPPTSSHAPPGQGIPLSPSYVGPSSPFHSLRFPSTMTTPPYAYSQSFPQSPVYPPAFTPPAFGQHYTPTTETEPQGTWYYLPHPTPGQPPYDPGPSYQGHYSVNYPHVGHSTAVEIPFNNARPSSSANPSSSSYPMSPSQTISHQYQNDNPTSSDPPLASAVDPRTQSRPDSQSSSSGRHQPISDRPVVRRSYHPNPPAHRSEWVMWVGNVPSDATHDELWRFFNKPPEARGTVGESPATVTGVLSIFLISRSGCAFVNYEMETFLQEAISRFNGVPLRAHDSRCPRLVCRVRRKDDDLKAGVGGQRGMGMHTRWIQEQKGKARDQEQVQSDKLASDNPSTPLSSRSNTSEPLTNSMANVSLSSDEDGKRGVHAKHSGSSDSYASTNSGFLTKYYPERFFILKSLTQEDLDISVSRGVWATQKHNEEILDQAFRTSKRVNLIFGVNKSGEFYGYARMSGPVLREKNRVSWATRSPPHPSSNSNSSKSHSHSPHPQMFFSPSDHRLVDESPIAVGEPTADDRFRSGIHQADAAADLLNLHQSAPAVLGEKYHLPTLITPSAKYSLDQRKRFQPVTHQESGSPDGFELDASAPARAMRSNQVSSSSPGSVLDGQENAAGSSKGSILQAVDEEEERRAAEPELVVEEGDRKEELATAQEASWGDNFAVEWISTERVPFHRTRHLRNPWNHDREVKVSRDGTELEPSVGQRLLDEWDKLSDPQGPSLVVAPNPTSGGKRGAGAKHAVSPLPMPNGPSEGGTSKVGPSLRLR